MTAGRRWGNSSYIYPDPDATWQYPEYHVTEPVLQLTVLQARVLGALIEKEVTTPDQYPLSINSLRLACNQKSNRDPFMETDEATVQETVNGLMRQFLVAEAAGNRVPRYRQSLCGNDHARFILSPQERALLCELLLRGPQTAGELRNRAQRMAPFPALADVETALQLLSTREGQPLVTQLPRVPGSREVRYAQLLSPTPEHPIAPAQPAASAVSTPGYDYEGRLAALESAVAALQVEVGQMRHEARPPLTPAKE
jgi:uncharacterized protein YceH (UPF0502 family)